MHITQKGEKIANTNLKNGKKWQKIANNCNISELLNMLKKCKKLPKM